ncbi:MAG TPA: archease [Anaeromyxobacteraceae bacterium]|nr:archease [Anaeromyxobacteraceae bacterium]
MRLAFPQPYRDLEHTADVGVAVDGASPEEALARLVLAEAQLLAGGADVVAEREERLRVEAAGSPVERALALLRELLFRFATERVLAAWCEVVTLSEGAAEVTVGLGRWDPDRHAEGLDLKAVTRHAARFEQDADGRWHAQVVFDI